MPPSSRTGRPRRSAGHGRLRRAPLAALVLALGAGPALAIGDGPRAYQLVPAGSQILTFGYIGLDGNSSIDPGAIIRGSSIDVNVGFLQYARSFEFAGQQAGAFAILPFGNLEGTLDFNANPLLPGSFSSNSDGLADMALGVTFGITGAPNLPLDEYVAYKPGFAAGILARVYLPTGAYDGSQLFNLGTNRWAVQVGGLFSQTFGDSFLDPRLTTIEVIPAVTVFGDNDDPFRGDTLSQDPLLTLEAHVTHNLSRAVWVSADLYALSGGGTETDGVSDDNDKYSLGLGATVSVALSRTSAIKATWGEVVDRNEAGMDGTALRVLYTAFF